MTLQAPSSTVAPPAPLAPPSSSTEPSTAGAPSADAPVAVTADAPGTVDDDGGAPEVNDARAPSGAGVVVIDRLAFSMPRPEPRLRRRAAGPVGVSAVDDGRPSAAAGPAGQELLSPFVAWADEDRAPLPTGLAAAEPGRSLLVDVLGAPASMVARLLDPAVRQATVLGCLGLLVGGVAFFAALLTQGVGGGVLGPRAVVALPVEALLALAAALLPIHATGLLLAVRVPLAQLVALLLSSAAAFAVVLAAAVPVPVLLWRVDDAWAGPLSWVGVFLLAGLAAGVRMRRLLEALAAEVTRRSTGDRDAALSPHDAFRVGILARMSMVIVGFSLAIALWGFDAFL